MWRRSFPLFLVLALFCVGCHQSASRTPGRVPRQASAPFLPEHSSLENFIGEWAEGEDILFTIHRDEKGRAVIEVAQSPSWDSVVNNVRFEGASLCFDQYMYYTGSEDFTTLTNPVGDHPYSGVRNASVLTPNGDDPDVLKYSLKTKDLDSPVESELERVKK